MTFSVDWFSVILATIAFLISMLAGFAVGWREGSNAIARQWHRHMQFYHGVKPSQYDDWNDVAGIKKWLGK